MGLVIQQNIENSVWDDLRVSAQNTKINPAQTKPDFDTFLNGILTYLFDKDADESVHFSVQLPHGYKLGTNLYPHVHWCPTNTDTGTVTWALEYTIANLGGTFGNTDTISESDAGDGVAYKHQLVSLPTITGSGITSVSSMLICRLFRDVSDNDTYNADAAFLEFDFHYEIDSLGSNSELTKE